MTKTSWEFHYWGPGLNEDFTGLWSTYTFDTECEARKEFKRCLRAWAKAKRAPSNKPVLLKVTREEVKP